MHVGLHELASQIHLDSLRLDGHCSSTCDSWLLTLDYCAASLLTQRVAPCLCGSTALARMDECASCLGEDGSASYADFEAFCSASGWGVERDSGMDSSQIMRG